MFMAVWDCGLAENETAYGRGRKMYHIVRAGAGALAARPCRAIWRE
jgi:hypothetical protein